MNVYTLTGEIEKARDLCEGSMFAHGMCVFRCKEVVVDDENNCHIVAVCFVGSRTQSEGSELIIEGDVELNTLKLEADADPFSDRSIFLNRLWDKWWDIVLDDARGVSLRMPDPIDVFVSKFYRA